MPQSRQEGRSTVVCPWIGVASVSTRRRPGWGIGRGSTGRSSGGEPEFGKNCRVLPVDAGREVGRARHMPRHSGMRAAGV